MRRGVQLIFMGMLTLLKNTPTKQNEYFVNPKHEPFDDVSFRGQFVRTNVLTKLDLILSKTRYVYLQRQF